MKFIVFDAGSHTGFAVFQDEIYLTSGCINTQNAKGNKLTYLEQRVKKILIEHQPDKVFIEQLYTFPIKRQGKFLARSNQMYASYWNIVNKCVSEFGCPCEYLDTKKLAKKKMAKVLAREWIKKKRYTDHEAECVVWSLYLLKRGL